MASGTDVGGGGCPPPTPAKTDKQISWKRERNIVIDQSPTKIKVSLS